MEKILELYKYVDGVNDTPFPNIDEQLIVREFRYDAKRMGGAPTISFIAMHRLCLDNLWSKDVYAIFNGERYYLKQTPTSSYGNSDTRYKHEVELISERSVLDNIYFYDVVTDNTNVDKPVSNSSKFTFFGDIHEYVNRLDYSLRWSNVDYTIVVDEDVFSEEKQVTFEDQVVTNALQEIYNIYQIPYYFVGKVIHVGEYQNNIDHVFKYGATNSLLSISKNNANAKIVNRITGVGSQDNIPYYYPNDDEKGVTIPLLNDSTNGVSISNQSKYRKVRLSDKFVFHSTIQTQTPLIDSSIYTLGDLTFDKKEEWKDAQYTVDFYYTFSLDDGENVLFEVSSNDESTVSLRYEIYKYKINGNHLGYFSGNNTISLTGGTYNFIIRWTFLNPNVMFGVEEELESLISSKLKISAYIVVDAEQTWTLKNIPVILGNYGLSVENPSDGDVISIQQVNYINPQTFLMPSIYRTSKGHERFYNAENDEYKNHYGEYYVFENEYSKNHPSEYIENFEDIKPTIKSVTNSSGLRIDRFVDFAYDLYDNDEVDEDGKFIHKWFFAKLNKFDGENGFNLFDHTIDESEMIISMTSGSCGSCSFKILVDKDTQKNTVQVDEYGNLLRDSNGNVRFGSPQDIQNDTENNEVWIALEKDIETFGVLMPNATNKYRPSTGDTFVILHIDLPKSYIIAAEKRLEEKLIEYMYDNNFEKFNFSIVFSRIFFAENPSILNGLNENSKITIEYNGHEYSLYASSISIAITNDQSLPEIKVELNDTISISQNQINQIVESTKKDILSKTTKDVFWGDIKGVPSWITSEKPRYSYNELSGRSVNDNDNDVWVIKKDEKGNRYVFTNLDVVTQKSVTMYHDQSDLDIPSIYDGLPIDWQTIYWEDIKDADGNVIGRVLKAAGGGTVNGITLEQLEAYLGVNKYATQPWVEGKGYLTSISKTMVTDALGYTPLDSTRFTKDSIKSTLGISDWALAFVKPSYKFSELLETPTTLSGYGIVDLVSSGAIQLGEKPKYAFPNYLNASSLYSNFWHTLIGYNGCGLIIGEASNDRVILQAFSNDDINKPFTLLEVQDNFVVTGDITTNGLLSVNGVSLRKMQNETLYIDGNLAVRGGITMYGIDSEDVPSIMDAIATDNVNLKVIDGVLTFVGQTGGGAADSVLWNNIEGKPSWIGSSKPSYSYSEIIGTPTLLSSFTNDLGLGSAAYKDASGTWGISITGSSSTSTLAKTLDSVNRSGSFTSDTESLVAFGNDSSIYFNHRWNGLQLASEYSRAQMLISGNGDIVVRTNEQANGSTTGWSSFIEVLTSNNFNSYALPLTGGIVSGTYETDASVVTINRSTHGNVLKLRSDASDYIYLNMSLADTYGVTLYSFGSNSFYVSHLGNKNTNFNIASNTITFGAWNTPKIYIDADSGYMGINTATPSHALHIASGNAYIGGKLYVSSNLCVGAAPKLSFPNYINASSLYSGYFHTLIGYNGAGIILGKSSSNDGVIMQCYHPDGLYNYFNIQSNLLVDGGITMYSDIRKKIKLQDVELSLQQIADAPLIEHYYNSDEKRTTHVGSIAQYWANMNDWFCKLDGEGYYTMEIQNAALASAISIARELVKYESKTDKKIRLLKKRIGELEDKIEELEKKGA